MLETGLRHRYETDALMAFVDRLDGETSTKEVDIRLDVLARFAEVDEELAPPRTWLAANADRGW